MKRICRLHTIASVTFGSSIGWVHGQTNLSLSLNSSTISSTQSSSEVFNIAQIEPASSVLNSASGPSTQSSSDVYSKDQIESTLSILNSASGSSTSSFASQSLNTTDSIKSSPLTEEFFTSSSVTTSGLLNLTLPTPALYQAQSKASSQTTVPHKNVTNDIALGVANITQANFGNGSLSTLDASSTFNITATIPRYTNHTAAPSPTDLHQTLNLSSLNSLNSTQVQTANSSFANLTTTTTTYEWQDPWYSWSTCSRSTYPTDFPVAMRNLPKECDIGDSTDDILNGFEVGDTWMSYVILDRCFARWCYTTRLNAFASYTGPLTYVTTLLETYMNYTIDINTQYTGTDGGVYLSWTWLGLLTYSAVCKLKFTVRTCDHC
jgi:hypothetical protein